MAARKLIILLLCSAGVPQMTIRHIGMLETHGEPIGEILEILELLEAKIPLEYKPDVPGHPLEIHGRMM